MTLSECIGLMIHDARIKAGLSKSDLIRAGVTNIGRYEKGVRCPCADSLFLIAEAVGCEAYDLLPKVGWDKVVEKGLEDNVVFQF